jgi:transposase InsO family protein
LNVVDEFTREALGCCVAPSIGGRDVAKELTELFLRHGRPEIIRSDDGREFVAFSLLTSSPPTGPPCLHRERASQAERVCGRFNGTMRDEKLNGEEFDSALEARVVLQAWIHESNHSDRIEGSG